MPLKKKERIMKKTSVKKNNNETKTEYDFNYKKAKPNRFARLVRKKTILIPLEKDVAEVFLKSMVHSVL